MDELSQRSQPLLDRPPVDPLPLEELRLRAARMRRRQRRMRAAAVGVLLVLAVGAVILATRSTSTSTLHTLGPAPTTTATTGTTQPSSIPGTHLPPKLAFAGTSQGWMASGGGCSSGSCADPILRHTDDGGRTWTSWSSVPATHLVQLDAETRRDLGGLVILAFADPQDGWYGQGGQLWSTHDGGHTWHRAVTAGTVVAMTTAGASTWALVARCATGSTSTVAGGTPSCPMALLTTASDRDQWGEAAPGLPSSGGGDLVGGDGSVWILTAGHLYRWAIGSYGGLLQAADPCAELVGMGPVRVMPIDAGRVGVLCTAAAVDGAHNTMAKTVVESSDGGNHWQLFATAPSTGWAGWATADGAGTVLVDTDGQTLWRSTGGAWSPVFRVAAPTGGMDQVLAVSARLAYVVVDGGDANHTVWVSRDGSRTWDPVSLP